jgi:hypothetical protein
MAPMTKSSWPPVPLICRGRMVQAGRAGSPQRRVYYQSKTSAGAWPAAGVEELVSDSGVSDQDRTPTAVELSNGDILVAWTAGLGGGLHQAESRLRDVSAGVWQGITAVPPADSDRRVDPSLSADGEGGAWLATVHGQGPTSSTIQVRRYYAGSWGTAMNLTDAANLNFVPVVILDPGSDIWVFWVGDRAGNRDVHVRQVFPNI